MTFDELLARLGGVESGGNYNAVNGRTGASGKYQIMPGNWPSWSREAGLGANAPRTAANQEKVARFKLGQYVDKYGVQGAAVAWYAGEDDAIAWLKNPDQTRFTRKQGKGDEPSINEYVAKVTGGSKVAAGTKSAAVQDGGREAGLTPQSTPAQIEQFIRANYPDVAGFLDNPELRAIMVDAAMKDEDDTEVLARLQRSKYWQENSPQSRAFDELRGRDRNAADQAVENARNVIGDAYSRLGVQASEADVAKIAENSIRAGWINLAGQVVNQAKLNDFAAWSLRRSGKPLSGETGMSAEALGQIARAYGVPVSRQFLEDKALRILEGGYTEDLFKQDMIEKAKGQWSQDPFVLSRLERGETTEQIFDSHRQTLAELWEEDPNGIDILRDPRLMEVTQFFDGEKRRAMTLGETAMFARKDDRYKKTRGAQKQAADFTMLVKREFEGVN